MPLSTMACASPSISRRRRRISSSTTPRSSASVRPEASALRKFAASRIAQGVVPAGGAKTRFSTVPSASTSTTSARPGARLTNSMWRIGASCLGASTSDAPCVSAESAPPTRSSMPATSRSPSPAPRAASIASRSSSPRSRTSRSPSTKSRSPSCVGTRPAETCGDSRRPRYSRSCMTLRMVAADTPSDIVRVSVREPMGPPVSR